MQVDGRRLVLGVLIIGVAAGVASLSGEPSTTEEGVLGPDQAFNCARSGDCAVTTVDSRPVDCDYAWPGGKRVYECQWIEEGAENISLITDQHDYINLSYRPFDAAISYYRTPGIKRMGDIEALPSGDLLITGEDSGQVSRFDGDSVSRVDTVDGVVANGTNGLLGIAVDPEFEQNRQVYLMYTDTFIDGTADRSFPQFRQRISRFRLVNGSLVDETVLVEGLPASIYHSGGGLEFGPDGLLYATVGDAHRGPYAQDVGRLNGKVLRMRRDGSVPDTNPFNGSLVYSYGHRNPQTLTWGPGGQLYVAEHGNVRYDEINRVEPGQNYGWPAYRCDRETKAEYRSSMTDETGVDYDRDVGQFSGPYKCYDDWTLAPGAVMAVTNRSDPAHGSMFVAGMHSKHLGQFSIGDQRPREYRMRFVNHRSSQNPLSLRLRALEYVDGRIYVGGDIGGLAAIDRRRSP